jgi:hypothetical protein
MAMFTFEVEVSIRKGVGPEWVHKCLSIVFDDIEPSTTDDELLDMVRREVVQEMRDNVYSILTIENN